MFQDNGAAYLKARLTEDVLLNEKGSSFLSTERNEYSSLVHRKGVQGDEPEISCIDRRLTLQPIENQAFLLTPQANFELNSKENVRLSVV